MKYHKSRLKASLLALALGITLSAHAASPPASLDEMWEIIQRQQQEIDQLKQQLQTTGQKIEQTEQKIQETDEKVEATSLMVEEGNTSTTATWAENTQLGGYGELHYNNLQNDKPGGSDKKEMDFHRFVLFFWHKFSDKVRFFSELELEHSIAGDGKAGEVELEQAFIDYNISNQLTMRGGLFLLPIGIINETHEPPVFYGTERNPVEKNIIPATWWEGGAGITGRPLPGLQYDLAIHSGLEIDEVNGYNIRKSRNKVAKAAAENLAITGRLKYTGKKGLELASSLQYQDDMGQGQDSLVGSAILWEVHAIYAWQRFTVKALYARWDLDGEGPNVAGKDEQFGWYIEPSYKFNQYFGIFARYNFWDNSAGSDEDTEYTQLDIGLNYWLHPNAVVKLDYQIQDTPEGKDEFNGFNVGLGYQFY